MAFCTAYLLTINSVYADIVSVFNTFYCDNSIICLYQNRASSYLSNTIDNTLRLWCCIYPIKGSCSNV